MRMHTKLTLVLLVTGLTIVGTIGVVAHSVLMQGFTETIKMNAFENFKGDVQKYLEKYGSWEHGAQTESFHHFVMSRGPRALPPPPPIARGDRPLIDRSMTPPFRFMLIAPDGTVLKGVEGYTTGDKIDPGSVNPVYPIEHNGAVAVLAIPLGDPILTPKDYSYLKAMQNALFFGCAVAALLAVAIGLWGGRRLSRSIEVVAHAVRSIHDEEDLNQRVPVLSNDEIGELAKGFNDLLEKLSETQKRMYEQSVRDPLTGLFNRRQIADQGPIHYAQAKRYDRPLSVMVGDLDHFKSINDTYSHDVGDKVLKEVADLLSGGTRASDLVTRYGGEEFLILFPETSAENAHGLCETLRHRIENHAWTTVHPDLRVTMSMGICSDLSHGSVDKMASRADELLYVAKNDGRNCVRCDGI